MQSLAEYISVYLLSFNLAFFFFRVAFLYYDFSFLQYLAFIFARLIIKYAMQLLAEYIVADIPILKPIGVPL